MLSDGRVRLEAVLDRAHYRQGEPVHVKLSIHNHSRKTVRRIKASLRQFFLQGGESMLSQEIAAPECAIFALLYTKILRKATLGFVLNCGFAC